MCKCAENLVMNVGFAKLLCINYIALAAPIPYLCSILYPQVQGRVTREISLHVQRRIRVDVGHVFGVKTNPYLKIKYTFEIFHQPAVKL